jgi:hypothetical protein
MKEIYKRTLRLEYEMKGLCSYRVFKSLCAPDNYNTKTRKNILHSFSHLPR